MHAEHLCLLAIGGLVPAIAFGASRIPTPVEIHPDFVFPAIGDGRPIALSDFRGKKILLIKPASW